MRETYEAVLWSLEHIYRSNKEPMVISSWSAASYWGFSPLIDQKLYITYEKGKTLYIKSNVVSKKEQISENYHKGIVNICFDKTPMFVYEPERTIVEIIKEVNGVYNDVLIETITMFLDQQTNNLDKVITWSKWFNIEVEVKKLFK